MQILIRLLFALALLCGLSVTAHAEVVQLQEQQIKAGLLYNFLKYTDWPAASLTGATLNICIFGDDPFSGSLNPIQGRTVNQHQIAIRYVQGAGEITNCQMLFVNQNEQSAWPNLHRALVGKSILTVSDFPGFAAAGGMIEFSHQNDHINANLDLDAVDHAGLHIEDRLLRLVTIVHGDN